MENVSIIKHPKRTFFNEVNNTKTTTLEHFELEYIDQGKLKIEFFDTLKEVKQFINSNK